MITLIVLLIVVISGVWVYNDAKRLEEAGAKFEKGWEPGVWCAGVIILWLIVFPMYLFRRNGYKKSASIAKNIPVSSGGSVNGPETEEIKPSSKVCPHCRKEIDALAKKCPHCQSDLRNWPNRHPILAVLFGLIILIFVIGIIGEMSGNSSNSTTPTQQAVATPSSNPCDNFSKSSVESISYKELDKDPSAYNGTAVAYTGQIVQIQEAPDGSGIIRISVTKESYGWSPNDIIYITYSSHTNAVNDDIVKVYGYLSGSQTYTSEANYQITIPSMNACEIDEVRNTPVTNKTTQTQTQTTQSAPIHPTQTPTPQPIAQTSPTVPKTWHTAITYSNNVGIKTQPFTMQGSQWRITYSCTTESNVLGVSGNFGGNIYSTDSGDMADDFADFVDCPKTDTSYVYAQQPGQYYLDLSSLEASYTVTVEDYY